MPPIPVYSDSPIAAKPLGVTPQTATPDTSAPQSAAAPTTTTATPTKTQASYYPPAQPGAVPSLPAPTGTAQAYVLPAQPTPTGTRNVGNYGPPPPQPGAVPAPTKTAQLPPPPKAGERYVPPPQQTSAPQFVTTTYPQQMAIPPPTAAYPAQQHGTSTVPDPSSAYGGQGPGGFTGQGGQTLGHPPGYHQNANASELDNYQASSLQRNESRDRLDETEGEGVWDQAKKWAAVAGSKIAAVESEAWKRINKE